MERSLAVAAALVDDSRIAGDQLAKRLGAIQMRGRARVNRCARGDESFRGRAGRRIQRVKSAGPPLAAPVRVGAEVEQHVDHRGIVGERDDGGSVEAEHGLIDPPAELGAFEETTHLLGVMTAERIA